MARKLHPDEQAFFNTIKEKVDDDLPRLVYADWLDEHNLDPLRAELIRTQCELQGMSPKPPRKLFCDGGTVYSDRNEVICVFRTTPKPAVQFGVVYEVDYPVNNSRNEGRMTFFGVCKRAVTLHGRPSLSVTFSIVPDPMGESRQKWKSLEERCRFLVEQHRLTQPEVPTSAQIIYDRGFVESLYIQWSAWVLSGDEWLKIEPVLKTVYLTTAPQTAAEQAQFHSPVANNTKLLEGDIHPRWPGPLFRMADATRRDSRMQRDEIDSR